MVIANRRYTDLFEWGQRTVPLSLAAEIQRRLLPATFTCEADQFTLAGWLEPAGEVGGDTFDFSLDRNTLHLSMTDAMGHSVARRAAGDARRRRAAQHRAGAAGDADRPGAGRARGAARVRHGRRLRHRPARARRPRRPDGARRQRRATRARSACATGGPRRSRSPRSRRFGAVARATWSAQELPLEPGDRVLFLTDGMLERNARRASTSRS